jgi:large repetitive protein
MKKIILGLLGLLTMTSSVWAATFSPTSTSDFPVSGTGISVNTATGVISGGAGNGQITLRSAVIAANANPGSTISLLGQTYTLTIPGDDGNGDPNPAVGDLDVLASVTITGVGPGSTIIQAGTSFDHGIDQILTLNSFFTSTSKSAVLNNFTSRVTGITFRYGTCTNLNTQSGSYAGGAISFDAGYNIGVTYNTGGSMTLSNCVFDSCSAHFGGGAVVTFDGGAVTIDSCVFTNNQGTPMNAGAGASGGAIVFGSTPNPVTNILKNTTFVGNRAGNGTAGAVLYFGGTGANSVGFIHNCVFTNNSADGESGAIDIAGPLTMDQGTLVISNRSSGLGTLDAQGGGVSISGGPAILSNCTIVGNTASLSSADQRGGGGIAVNSGPATISNCRIFGNVANTGSGLHKDLNPGNVTANDNWWGNNGGPGVGGADTSVIGGAGSGGGTLTLTTWLVLNFTASPSALLAGGTSALTASITKNSAAATGFTVPDFTRASFGATLGTDSPAAANFSSGTALSTFTAGATGGSGNASVTVDAQTLNAALTINQPPAITSANTTTFTVGTAGSFTVTTTGVPAPIVNASGALPAGVSFTSGTAKIAGTPGAGTGGSYPLTLTATNVVGTNTQSFTLIVNQPAAITNANSATFTVGSAGSFKIAATGFPAPTLSESNSDVLPANVSFNAATGVLGGTPLPGSGGIHVLHFVAHNGVGADATQTLTLTVNEAPAVTCPASILTNATGGVCLVPSVAFAATATGFPAPVIGYKLGAVSLTSPTTFPIGTNVVIVTATNSIGTNTCNFTVTVQPGPAPLLSATMVSTNIVLSWPTNGNCYTLQSAPAANSTNWQTVPGVRITNSANLFVTNGISTNLFFRLAH